jgi:hypothetical protein
MLEDADGKVGKDGIERGRHDETYEEWAPTLGGDGAKEYPFWPLP